ncbi:hypothetical protein HWV62_33952 [Athelia sp. TMB]|nr:hypothetical protein HWV62_33952 [Athelia sp. TMB]
MSPSETSPLLQASNEINNRDVEAVIKDTTEVDPTDGEEFDNVPRSKRQLGTASAVFLIFNRVIGTGIFATPSVILRSSGGSVGVSFLMWIAGAAVAFAGTAVYIELGSGMPRSGGEKNYLEFIYRRPRFLTTCVYAVYALFMGWSSANSIVFAEYMLHALSLPATAFLTRALGTACLTFVFLLHSCFFHAGLRLQNFLGAFKLLALLLIAVAAIAHKLGVPGFQLRPGVEPSHALDSWSEFWARSEGGHGGWNAAIIGITNVIWSFIGYSNANYALSEVKNPVRTIRRAAPFAIGLVSLAYLLVNWAYIAVVAKADVLGSGRIIAALFFGNLFGPAAERVLSVVIALSCLGNVLVVMFTQARLVQEFAREGVLPPSASKYLSSNAPFGAPMSGLGWQWLISGLVMVCAPPGDAYLFLLNRKPLVHPSPSMPISVPRTSILLSPRGN